MSNSFSKLLVLLFLSSCTSQHSERDISYALPDSTSGFVFYVIGDWGRDGAHNQKKVAAQMDMLAPRLNPLFVVSTGDNFYGSGVKSIDDSQWKTSFLNIYDGVNIAPLTWYPVLGNHDYRSNHKAQIDFSEISDRWHMPSEYYTISKAIDDSTSARFIFLDTNPYIKSYYGRPGLHPELVLQDTVAQTRWLDSVLTVSTERWKFVIGHHPVYSYGTKHSNYPEIQQWLKPRLEKYGIDIYFSGHEHDLQHLRDKETMIDYVVSGAGSRVRKAGAGPETLFHQAQSGFNAVVLTSDSASIYYIGHKGDVLYLFERKK